MDELIMDNNSRFLWDQSTPSAVKIWDETMRGGEQSPGVVFDEQDKIELAEVMDEMGVAVIDAGFPMMSEGERESIRALLDLGLDAEIGVTVRCEKDDIDAAVDLGAENLYMFSTTSRFHLRYKEDMKQEECRERVLKAANYADERGVDFDFISEDTTRSELDFIVPLFEEVKYRGARRLIICDTVSSITPQAMFAFTQEIINQVGEGPWGVHCHNDFGLAVANTISAVQAGVEYPTLTVNSLGDSSGNPSMEEVVMILEKLMKVDTGIETEQLYDLCKMVEEKSGLYLSPQKPICGFNSYRHESEVHVSGVLAHSGSYEPIDPEEVGREREFVLGKHSGPTNVKQLLKERGIELTDGEVEEVLRRIEEEKEMDRDVRIADMLEYLDDYNDEVLGFSEESFWHIVEDVKGE